VSEAGAIDARGTQDDGLVAIYLALAPSVWELPVSNLCGWLIHDTSSCLCVFFVSILAMLPIQSNCTWW
jgi:hypothetical protein